MVKSNLEVIKEGIIISSFDSEIVLNLQSLSTIEASEFEIHFSKDEIKPTTKTEYTAAFKTFHKAVTTDEFSKIVLSKIKEVTTDKSALTLFESICDAYPDTFNYIFSSEEYGCWIGATPELLCNIENLQLKTVSLAGTKLPIEEWTSKELEEQAFVTDYIKAALEANGLSEIQINGPKTVSAGKIEHLKSEIYAKLTFDLNWQSILNSLHPTPAVCGIPTNTSKAFILKNESHSREFYTGFIGIIDVNVNCFVNLRCMQLQEKKAYLYLGGGLLKASTEEKEWDETERKAQTLERFLNY